MPVIVIGEMVSEEMRGGKRPEYDKVINPLEHWRICACREF